ncbi:hypothetical protein DFH08DRAFT_815217 [Mycena albidolilacea]|uniref:Uncharacterized protein n=1 Tax=Mycena albidolilacea TaxID=1033008 RepID=A0AAD7EKM8_9AGAR|nr:hypothetical protein DFH08DRAFT_815217 [Mycena albidolilacea]
MIQGLIRLERGLVAEEEFKIFVHRWSSQGKRKFEPKIQWSAELGLSSARITYLWVDWHKPHGRETLEKIQFWIRLREVLLCLTFGGMPSYPYIMRAEVALPYPAFGNLVKLKRSFKYMHAGNECRCRRVLWVIDPASGGWSKYGKWPFFWQHHGHSRTAAVEKPNNDVKMLHIMVGYHAALHNAQKPHAAVHNLSIQLDALSAEFYIGHRTNTLQYTRQGKL